MLKLNTHIDISLQFFLNYEIDKKKLLMIKKKNSKTKSSVIGKNVHDP